MIDDRFSTLSFSSCERTESDNLAKVLEHEISIEIKDIIKQKLSVLIGELNSLGHNLRLYFESGEGEISYRDFADDSGDYFKLRISVEVMVDVGYKDAKVFKDKEDYEEYIDQLCQRLKAIHQG